MRSELVLILVVLTVVIVVWMLMAPCGSQVSSKLRTAGSPLVHTPLTPDRLMTLLRDPSTKQAIMAKFADKGDLSNSETFIDIMLDHVETILQPRK